MKKAVKVLRKGFAFPEIQIFLGGIPRFGFKLNHMEDQVPDFRVFDLRQLTVLRAVFTLAIFVHLTEREDWRLEKKLCNHAAGAEDVHRPIDMTVSGLFIGKQKPLRGQVTCSSP